MNKATFYTANTIRVLIGVLFLLIFVSDLYSIFLDPDTYDKVYTGEFLGEGRFKTLYHLILSHCIAIGTVFIYLIFVVLHLTKLNDWKMLTWVLRVIDIIIALVLIGYVIPNIVRDLLY